jgi:glutathione S-transferase
MPDPAPFTLYYAPHVCSLVPHIALRELGVRFDLVRVDLRGDRGDLVAVNPSSYVPVLVLGDGERIIETGIILGYLADAHPAAGLAPPPGSRARLRFDQLLHFIATELHKGFAPFTIMAAPSEESRRWAADRMQVRVDHLAGVLGDRAYLHGDGFTVLDIYAFWALRTFAARVGRALTPALTDYVARIADRPAVRAAIEAERAAR